MNIPLYGADKTFVGEFAVAYLDALPNVEVVRNKRQVPKRAMIIAELQPTLPKSVGFAFKQEVPSGWVWALKGVRGSERVSN